MMLSFLVRKYFLPSSLKRRLIAFLLISSFIPLILIGWLSYYSIFSILDHKIRDGIQSNLKQVRLSLENTLSNLNHASQQLSYDGRLGKSMEKFLSSNNEYFKAELGKDIETEMALLNITNPSLGVMFYYLSDTNKTLLSSYRFRENFDLERLPLLAKFKDISYYGPHLTMNPVDNHFVLSIVRHVNVPESDHLNVYIETNFSLVQNILESGKLSMHGAYAFVDQEGRIAFSEEQTHFPVGSTYLPAEPAKSYRGNFIFEELSNQGWKIIAIVPKSFYNQEINKWIALFIFFAALSLLVSFMIAWAIWRIVYRPLVSLNKEIYRMENSNFHSPVKLTMISEFDNLLHRFQQMRQRVWDLLLEVEQKERSKMQLEMDKLLHQINPHFIHNTLDTIRWLARINGQQEIDRTVSTLNRLLYYNLGKGGGATIKEELEALKDYITLQQIRYDFQFNIHIIADEQIIHVQIPRFILQPLVENSLYHGLGDDGTIEVSVTREEDSHVLITVSDNGAGMTEEEIEQLINDKTSRHKKVGMGIGINYVRRMIKIHFGEDAQLHIESSVGSHTRIQMRLPLKKSADGEGGSV